MFSCPPFIASSSVLPSGQLVHFSFSLAQVHLQDLHWATSSGRLHRTLSQYILQINSMCYRREGLILIRLVDCRNVRAEKALLFIKSSNSFPFNSSFPNHLLSAQGYLSPTQMLSKARFHDPAREGYCSNNWVLLVSLLWPGGCVLFLLSLLLIPCGLYERNIRWLLYKAESSQ